MAGRSTHLPGLVELGSGESTGSGQRVRFDSSVMRLWAMIDDEHKVFLPPAHFSLCTPCGLH